MKCLLAWLAGTLLLLVLAAGGLLLAALEDQALVARSATISPLSIAQARWLLQRNDPRRLRQGDLRQAAIPASLVDEAANYAATRFLRGRAAFRLGESGAELRYSLQLPDLPGGERFMNLRLGLVEQEGLPAIATVHIGPVPVPPTLAEALLAVAVRLAGREREWQLGRQAIQKIGLQNALQRVIVTYAWEPALLESARSVALDREDMARLRSAHEMLVGLLDQHASGSRVELAPVLASLLDVNGIDQRENRRAALFVLAAYLSERRLATLLPEAANWPAARSVRLLLRGRIDSAQHFVISAALAAWAGEPLADAIGVYKELADARHGGGFSFADLAADRAGTAFGESLLRRPERLDQLLQEGFDESAIVPALSGLPEYLGEREFRNRFGQPGSPAYQQVIAEIDRRLFALPLHQREMP